MSLLMRALRPRPAARSVMYGLTPFATPPMSYASVMGEDPESLAKQKIAIWSSWDLICSLGSELPWDVYREDGSRTVKVTKPSYMEDPGGDGYGYQDWAYQLLLSYLSCGNTFGEVLDFDERGAFPKQVNLYPRSAVDPQLRDGLVSWTIQGRPIPAERMWHTRAYPAAGYVLGMSPIGHHMTTIGQGVAAARFGMQFFTDGGHPTGMLTNEMAELDSKQIRVAKDRYTEAIHGSREPIVMGKGWKFEQVQITPDESQFLETQRFTEAMCCRIYGPGVAEILGYSDEHSMTYTNVVDRRADFLVLSGNKWLNRLERVLTAMLPKGRFARLNRAALLQSTTLDRYKAHELALRNRWTVVNEVRDLEDMPPVPWGDQPNELKPAPAGGAGE